MDAVAGFLSAVFWGVLILSILVFLHEGGHYLAARACGMRVTEFFLGLPSRFKLSRKSKRYGTEVGVTPVLLGGYTRITGMECEEDELLAPALACVQRCGRVTAERLAKEVGCDLERAYGLLASLADWGSIQPFYNPEKGEVAGQRDWPAEFETVRRDARWRTEYDRMHDFAEPGCTEAGQARPVENPEAFLKAEWSQTYLGKGILKRIVTLFAGPAVNLLVAFVLIVFTLCVLGVDVTDASGELVHTRVALPQAIGFALGYGGRVIELALQLIMPAHTMEVLESSSSVVGISVMASQAASLGLADLLFFVASISTSLGIMNLLPIPPLDGGKILIEIIQLVIRRPLSTRAQNAVSYVGLAFFVFVFVIAVHNDIGRIMAGG